MKKTLLPFVLAATLATALSAQCPTQIQDQNADGTAYLLTLTNISQCPANATTITINTVNYSVNDCGDLTGNGTPILLQLVPAGGSAPVVLSTAAPVTISGGGFSNCMYNSSGNPIALPIELVTFKGTPSVAGNVLTWQTANEMNNKGFEVERRTGGSQQAAGDSWETVGFVAAKGKSATYTFTDDYRLSPVAYYRLKQVDNDGKFAYSKVISIAQTSKGKGLSIYPNPVSSHLTIENTEGSDFQILNLLGQQVLTGKTAQRLDVSALPQGTYVLKVGAEQVKFVKQ